MLNFICQFCGLPIVLCMCDENVNYYEDTGLDSEENDFYEEDADFD